jgi:ATP-dependent Clp protease ATP-binding subunit ClpA
MAAAGGRAPAVEEVMALTRDRSFKKVVRDRMRRTGESYTAARAEVERSAPPSRPERRGGSGMFPFERFTERAKEVLILAQHEAEAAGHSYIGTEHLLLGLLREEAGLGAITLKALGVELPPVREAIAAILGASRLIVQQMVPTARVKKVIELSFDEAHRMGHNYVGTEHLVLGLLVEGEGVAAKVLADMGVTLAAVRAEIERQLTERAAEPVGPRRAPVLLRTPPMTSDLRRLILAASDLAGNRGSFTVGIDHLLDAMITPAGIEALARLLDVRRHAAAREQAITSQDYEAAAGHRTAEREARQRLDEAIAAWRRDLEPPQEGVS